jgi:hypothetical protein
VVAITWSDLVAGGFFIAGIGVGVIITMRVARVVAQFLTDLRKKEDDQ